MNSYFVSLDAIVQKRKLSNHIRFLIQEVVDLRNREWRPLSDDSAPKEIEQICKESKVQDQERLERGLNNPQFQRNMGPMGDGVKSDRVVCHNRKQSRNYFVFFLTIIIHFQVVFKLHK